MMGLAERCLDRLVTLADVFLSMLHACPVLETLKVPSVSAYFCGSPEVI